MKQAVTFYSALPLVRNNFFMTCNDLDNTWVNMFYNEMTEMRSIAITASQNVLKMFKDIELPTLPPVKDKHEIKGSSNSISFLALKVDQFSITSPPFTNKILKPTKQLSGFYFFSHKVW